MLGLIKKDLLMIKNNYKSIIITLIIYIFYSYQFKINMSFLIPFMGLMLCISTISYDDFNNWHLYASSLPKGKIGLIKSKYITTLSVISLLSILSLIMDIFLNLNKGDYIIIESIEIITGSLFGLIFTLSILFPILFKFGAEKGRIAMIIIGFTIFGIIYYITNIFEIKISTSFIDFIDSYYPILFVIISTIMLSISYAISKKVYLKKEI